jgi:anti-sigma factor RsiW
LNHDPERDAAAFLGGAMSLWHRRRFEQHVLECEECWREVEAGRRGRALAESGRELAPQFLRERVRAAVGTGEPSPVRLRGIAPIIAILIAIAVAAVMWGPGLFRDQPGVISAVVEDFSGRTQLEASAERQLPEVLGDLRLTGVRAGRADGMSVVVHTYEDLAGHTVAIYQAEESFPVAEGAEHDALGATWSIDIDGTKLFCVDEPVPSLVLGEDAREVRLAVAELGLR